MSDPSLRLLLVGGELPLLAAVLPLLQRIDFQVEHAADGSVAGARLFGEHFDLVIVGYPLPAGSLSDLIARLRAVGSLSRQAGLLVVSLPDDAEEVRNLLGRGVNRVITADDGAEGVLFAVADLLGTAPRAAIRAVVQLEVRVGRHRAFGLYRTRNVSSAGMLVQCPDIVPVGTRCSFELSVPGLVGPIRGEAEIVRQTDPERERMRGFAVRFLSFQGDGGERLQGFINDHGT
jgi:CheY-like chemotaxis protein